MKDNKPIIAVAIVFAIIIGGLLVTGEYERFLPADVVEIEYPELPDYGYDSGFSYEYVDSNETQESLEAEYYRNNPDTGFDNEDFDIRYDRVCATNSSNEIFNYGLQGNILYPGAMVLAISTDTGALISIPSVQRGPATFSINQEGTQNSGSLTAKVTNVNQSNVRTAVNSMIDGKDLSQFNTVIDYQYHTIKSTNEFNLSIGADVNIRDAFNVSDKFTSKSSNIATRSVMIVKQICFEVTMDHPKNLSSFFDSSWATVDNIKKAFGTEATPLYVSGVAYGRTLIITAESTLDETTLQNTLTAGFKSSFLGSGASISNTIASMTTDNETTISVQVVGGNSQEAIGIIKAANGILTGDANLVLDNFSYTSATPIIYRLSNLDGSTAMIQSANEYVIQTLVPNSHRVLDWDSVNSQINEASKGNGLIDGDTLKFNFGGMTFEDSDIDENHIIRIPDNINKLIIKSSESLTIPNFSLILSPNLKEFTLELYDFNATGTDSSPLISFTGRNSYSLHSVGAVSLVAGQNQTAIYSDSTLTIIDETGTLSIEGGDGTYSSTYTDLDPLYTINSESDLILGGNGQIVIHAGDGFNGTVSHKNGGNGGIAIKATTLTINSTNRITIYGGNGGTGHMGDTGEKGENGNGQHISEASGKDGSPGGRGGDGGNGGAIWEVDSFTIQSGKIIAYIGAGGNGGDGGRGGDGGNGDAGIIWHGTGGNGGKGGTGGNGGNKGLSIPDGTNITTYQPNNANGGQGGPGGTGGEGGKWLGVPNSSGSNGPRGNNGQPGK